MPQPTTLRRRAAFAAALGVGVVTLVACQKPLPQVTFQSGTRSVLVSPTNYCFDGQQGNCPQSAGALRSLRVSPGSAINISVPRTVALQAWIASASKFDDEGKQTPLEGLGSNLVVDNHYARVPVPDAAGDYLLQVTEIQDGRQNGAWTVRVDVGATR